MKPLNSEIVNTKPLDPDYDQAEKFLTLLDESEESFTFQTFDDSPKKRQILAKVISGTLDDCWAQLVVLNRRGSGVFVTVNATDLKGRKKENITRIRALWQEDDDKGATQLPVEPHVVVESSPGKYHRYILTDSTALAEFDQVQQVLVDQYGSDPNAKDISRVLRLPGFFHMKNPAKPTQVNIVQESGALPLPWDELKTTFPPRQKSESSDRGPDFKPTDIPLHVKRILTAENYNGSMCSLTASFATNGMSNRQIEGVLKGLMDSCPDGNKDDRWQTRRNHLPIQVKTAVEKFASSKGATDTKIETPDWPTLSKKALPGIAGEFVHLATKNSEADPAAVLATFLVRFGVDVGAGPHMMVGDTAHRCRLASVLVGDSSKARKGTSGKPVKRLFKIPPTDEFGEFYQPAHSENATFSTGEGIIYLIRDEIKKYDDKEQQWVVTDPGIDDKRLFIIDEEFAGVMANTKREGNTLSMIIRQMWDSGDLAPIIKNKRTIATGGHVGWVSHITLYELNTRLDESQAFNGFANRILWVCSQRKKFVPWPVPMDETTLKLIQKAMVKLIVAASPEQEIKPDTVTQQAWTDQHYEKLSRSRPGLLGAVTNRAEAQTLRLAMVYCLLDGKTTIELPHLESALAFWDYCEQSANFIFHGKSQDTVARKMLDALQEGPKTGTEINRLFASHVSRARLETALSELLVSGCLSKEEKKTSGRSTNIYKIKTSYA